MSSEIYYCNQCYSNVHSCGGIVAHIYETICEYYVLTNEALSLCILQAAGVPDLKEAHLVQIMKLLEEKRYIVTTENEWSEVFILPSGHAHLEDCHAFCRSFK
jgi:hypothetical protein